MEYAFKLLVVQHDNACCSHSTVQLLKGASNVVAPDADLHQITGRGMTTASQPPEVQSPPETQYRRRLDI